MVDNLDQKLQTSRPVLEKYRARINSVEPSPQSIKELTEIARSFARDIGILNIPMAGGLMQDGKLSNDGTKAGVVKAPTPYDCSDYSSVALDIARKYVRSYALLTASFAMNEYGELLKAEGLDPFSNGLMCMMVLAHDELESRLKND